MLDAPVCLSAPTHRIQPLAEMEAAAASDARALSGRLLLAAERISSSLATPRGVHLELGAVVQHMGRTITDVSSRNHPPDVPSAEQSAAALERAVDRKVLELASSADLAAARNALARYDAFFGTRRREVLDAEQFLRQVMLTTEMILQDLPSCMLDSHEIVMILRGVAAGCDSTNSPGGVDDECPDTDLGLLDETVPPDRLGRMAIWRWKVGHHLFSQLAVMSLHLIEAAMASPDPEVKAANIARLCDTYRGATAAMWYAQAFPPTLYVEVVRPSMEAASSGGNGFSGTDSLDFRLMKLRLRRMLALLEEAAGPVDTWPEVLWYAVRRLYEVQQLDLEHHVLIAEKLVGTAPSLKQLRMAENCGGRVELSDLTGIDTLRGMVAERAEAKAKFLAS